MKIAKYVPSTTPCNLELKCIGISWEYDMSVIALIYFLSAGLSRNKEGNAEFFILDKAVVRCEQYERHFKRRLESLSFS